MIRFLSGGVVVTALPYASGPALLGEAAMRHKDQLRRRGEVPKSGEGHPPIPPVDFAPSLNWPGSNAPRENLSVSCYPSDLLIKFGSPLDSSSSI